MRAERVVMLCPSRGLGGGIERFCHAILDALERRGVDTQRLDLTSPGKTKGRIRKHASLWREADATLAATSQPTRLVVMHRALLPLALLLLRKHPQVTGVSLVLFGIDIWGGRPKPELALLRHRRVRTVAISAFSAGALGADAKATILHPTISSEWYHQLLAAADDVRPAEEGGVLRIATVFRLDDWEYKGLPTLIRASEMLGIDYQLSVYGSGSADAALAELVAENSRVRLRPGLSDSTLAGELAASDVVVLATRLRGGSHPMGEGYGLVTIEGQLAGTATIAPAFGGGHDTIVEGVTGYFPVDETPEALAGVLRKLLDPVHRAQIAAAGHAAAKAYFDPERQADRIISRLL